MQFESKNKISEKKNVRIIQVFQHNLKKCMCKLSCDAHFFQRFFHKLLFSERCQKNSHAFNMSRLGQEWVNVQSGMSLQCTQNIR